MNLRFPTACALLGVLLLAACQKPAEPIKSPVPGASVEGNVISFPKDSPQLSTLRTAAVAPERESRVRINGRTAWDETLTSRVNSPVAGRVSALLAMPGASLRRGQTMAVISSPEFGQTQADARRAENDLIFAERNLARANELLKAGVIALKEQQAAENDHARARTERERTLAKERLYGGAGAIDQQFKLVSPIDGVVVQRQVTLGQEIRPEQSSDQPLFVISNPARLWVLLDVPEILTREIQIGELVRIGVPALPGETFSARVEYIADAIDPQTRTVRARAALDNRDRRLKAEMYITGDVEIPPTAALKVPSTAVYLLGDTHYAFVEESAGRFVRRALKAEEGSLGSMRVSSGLAMGEKVVADGALLLQQLISQKATAPRNAAAAPR
ncbi:MAG: efflux RND transporter periplasmic adaptor subunit [Burkholderiales bacterium]|nr:efflux RND transporter periplasmic adaptor subunit [Burkholderiales bacterium]